MALKLYTDSDALNEITNLAPDEAKGAVASGATFTNERAIWMKSDNTDLTYENITITKSSDSESPAITLEYAPDDEGSAGSYVETLEPDDGDYVTVYKFWRRVTKANVTEAFARTDVNHQVQADEYIA